MTAPTLAPLKELLLPAASSTHPEIGAAYEQDAYAIKYSHGLTIPEDFRHYSISYYDLKSEIPEGFRMSTAAEELAMQLMYERAINVIRSATMEKKGRTDLHIIRTLRRYAKDKREKEAIGHVFDIEGIGIDKGMDYMPYYLPRDRLLQARAFRDLFGTLNEAGERHRYLQYTETFLRVPEGTDPFAFEKDSRGRRRYVREFGIGKDVMGITFVPEGGVVPEIDDLLEVWDPITGLPRVTFEDIKGDHSAHFEFSVPNRDSVSGHLDTVVVRMDGQFRSGHEYCLFVDATHGRSEKNSFKVAAHRLVRGPLPRIG